MLANNPSPHCYAFWRPCTGTQDFLGEAAFDLAAACDAAGPGKWAEVTRDLGGDAKAKGTLSVAVRRHVTSTVSVLSASKLRNADGFFGKSDPYARVKGLTAFRKEWGATATVQNNLSPTWGQTAPNDFIVDALGEMVLGGKLWPLVVEVWDEDGKQRGPGDDALGAAEVPWRCAWPDAATSGKEVKCPLKGSGAGSGSSVSVRVVAAAGGLGAAGKALLQSAMGGGGGGAAAAAAEGEFPPIPVHKKACKAVLGKGMGFKIADCTDDVADKFTLGLAWDVTGGRPIDLDASCVMLDRDYKVVDTVYFGQLHSRDRSMHHHGDQRSGEASGDDESISFDLAAVDPRVVYLCFCINSFSGQELNDVANARCRLYNSETGNETSSFDLSADAALDCTAMLMAILYRANPSADRGRTPDWFMHAVGEPAMGRTVNDNVDEFQHFLGRVPLVKLMEAYGQSDKPPPQRQVIKLPAGVAGGGKIAFASPGAPGGKQQVTVPAQCRPGDAIEVQVVDIFMP